MENSELASAPVGALMLRYMGTTLVGMLAQAIMVMLEGVIIGNGYGSHGLAVVAILMPLEYLNLALCSALAMGVATVVGNRLGAGDKAGAQEAFDQGFWLTLYAMLAVSAVLAAFPAELAVMLGATDAIVPDCALAIRVFAMWYPLRAVGTLLTSMLRIEERPGLASAAMAFAAAAAVGWLALSTFVLGLGMAGVAHYYGGSIGLYAVVLPCFLGRRAEFRVSARGMRVAPAFAREALSIGLPSFLVQAALTVYNALVNNMLVAYGGDAAELQLAAFALINGYIAYDVNIMWQCAQFAVQPIASVSHGAGDNARLRRLVRSLLVDTAVFVGAASLAFIAFARPVCAVFAGGDEALVELASANTPTMVALCCLGSLAAVMSTYFQAVERVGMSVLLGVLRYLVLAVPLMLLACLVWGIDGVWWSMPMADVAACLVTLAVARRETRRLAHAG